MIFTQDQLEILDRYVGLKILAICANDPKDALEASHAAAEELAKLNTKALEQEER